MDDLKGKIRKGLQLLQQGRELITEVRENIAKAGDALSTTDKEELERMLDDATAETVALNEQIQRA